MKTDFLFLTIIYALVFLYAIRRLVVGLIVIAANRNLGHRDTYFSEPENPIFLALTIVFGFFGYAAFRCYQSPDSNLFFKWVVLLPLGLVLLSSLWAIITLISAGGIWS